MTDLAVTHADGFAVGGQLTQQATGNGQARPAGSDTVFEGQAARRVPPSAGLETAESERAMLQQTVDEQTEHLDALVARLGSMADREAERRALLLDAHEQLLERDREIQTLQARLARREEEIGAKIASLRAAIAARDEKVRPLQGEVDTLREENKGLRERAARRDEEIAAKIASLRAKLAARDAEGAPHAAAPDLAASRLEQEKLQGELGRTQATIRDLQGGGDGTSGSGAGAPGSARGEAVLRKQNAALEARLARAEEKLARTRERLETVQRSKLWRIREGVTRSRGRLRALLPI